MLIDRRALMSSMIGGAVCGIAGVGPSRVLGATTPAGPMAVRFDAYHGKSKIGYHRVSVVPDGATTKVTTKIDMDVSVVFIRLFVFRHDAVETWENGRVIALESHTNDDGDKIKVSGAAVPEGFRIVGPAGPAISPPETLTSNSLWQPAFLEQKTAIDVQYGGVIGISIKPLGDESVTLAGGARAARKYRLITPHLSAMLWYDAQGQWIKAAFEKAGERIEYRLAG